MHYRLDILLAGRSREDLALLETLARRHRDLNVTTRLIVNGHADPLQDMAALPDALVFAVSGNWQPELEALAARPASACPPMLVVGPQGNVELIRMAMRAGARDFTSLPACQADIDQFLDRIVQDRRAESARTEACLTAVINAKGGSGASVVAANLGRILAAAPKRRVVLMDLDLQFGTLPLYFNQTPRNGLMRALEMADSLDALALEGYVQPHESGLDLVAAAPDDFVLPAEVPEARVELLLQVLAQAYDDIVVDLPRWVGGATAVVLERAERVLVVMEQTVAHLRDAKRMLRILQQELRIPHTRVTAVVNRFDKRSVVTLRAIREAMPDVDVLTLTNDFRRVTESVNVGTPLPDIARNAAITRDLLRLSERIHGEPPRDGRAPEQRRWFRWARAV